MSLKLTFYNFSQWTMFTVRLHALRLTHLWHKNLHFQMFSTISSSTLVAHTRYAPPDKSSTKHESEQTLGNKLYPIRLPSFDIIFLLIWKILMRTNFLNKLSNILNNPKIPWHIYHFEHLTPSKIHCSYGLVCLFVFAFYLLISFNPKSYFVLRVKGRGITRVLSLAM